MTADDLERFNALQAEYVAIGHKLTAERQIEVDSRDRRKALLQRAEAIGKEISKMTWPGGVPFHFNFSNDF